MSLRPDHRYNGDGQQADQREADQNDPVVEGQTEGAAQQPEWNPDQDGERKVRHMVQRRVAIGRQIPWQPGHRRGGPVDAVDGLSVQESVNGRLDLEQAVVFHRQAERRPLDHGDQRRSDGGQGAQHRGHAELESPTPLDPHDQPEQCQDTPGADRGDPRADVGTQGPEQQDLQPPEHGDVGKRGGQPGGDPGQRYRRSTGRRSSASHDDGVTTSARNPFSEAL